MPSSAPEEWADSLREEIREHERERNVSRYQIRSVLGEGATAVVYEAWDAQLNRPVALKLLREAASMTEVGKDRFRREAQAGALLTHPNVAAVYDVGEDKGRPFIVMEKIDGRPLSEVLKDPNDERAIIQLLHKTANGVAAAHERGIVHRDLKPSNILVTASGEPKVVDFGLARSADSLELTRTGTVLGTPLYMAPEQVEGRSSDISPRTDVYALGAILYEAVTGRPPHQGETFTQLYGKILRDEPVAPRKLKPNLSRDVETIILKAMDKDPLRRYASAGEIAEDLRRLLAGEPILARRASFVRRLRGRIMKNPIAYAFAAGAAIMLAVALLVMGKFREERELAVKSMRDTARLSVQSALDLRRNAGNAEMRRLLPSLQQVYRGAVERAPDLAEVEYLMGRMYRALMDDEKALECQERALGKDARYAPALYERAVLLSKKYGRELRKAFESHRALESGSGEDVFRAGPAGTLKQIELSRPELAALRGRVLGDCEKLQHQDGITEASVLAARGILAYHRGAYAEAQEVLEAAVKKNPAMEEAWETLARSAQAQAGQTTAVEYRLRKWREAEAWYAQGAANDKGYVQHLIGLSDVRVERGLDRASRGEDPLPDYMAAEEDLVNAFRLEAQSSEALTKLGMVRTLRGGIRMGRGESPLADFSTAEEDLSRALRLDAASAEAWAKRGLVRSFRGIYLMALEKDPAPDYAAAEVDFSRARAIDGKNPELWIWWGYMQIHRAVYWMRLKRDPTDEFANADKSLSEALRLNREHLSAWRYRAYLWTKCAGYRESRGDSPLEDYDKAERDLRKAVELNPESLNAWKLLGEALNRRGMARVKLGADPLPDLSVADEAYTRAMELCKTDAWAMVGRGDVRINRAVARESAGDKTGAAQDFAAAAKDIVDAIQVDPRVKSDIEGRLSYAQKKSAELNHK